LKFRAMFLNSFSDGIFSPPVADDSFFTSIEERIWAIFVDGTEDPNFVTSDVIVLIELAETLCVSPPPDLSMLC